MDSGPSPLGYPGMTLVKFARSRRFLHKARKREAICIGGSWIPALRFATAGMTKLPLRQAFFRILLSS